MLEYLQKQLIQWITSHLDNPWCIIAGWFLIVTLGPKTFTPALALIASHTSLKEQSLLFYCIMVCLVSWAYIWSYLQQWPRAPRNTTGIAIGITHENEKQANRVIHDLIPLLQNGLQGTNMSIVALPSWQTSAAQTRRDPKNRKRLLRTVNRANCRMVILGHIEERLSGQNHYILRFWALLTHPVVSPTTSVAIKKSMDTVFPQQVIFPEKYELTGFETTASNLAWVSQYFIGLAHLISGQQDLALNIHHRLWKEIKAVPNAIPPLQKQLPRTLAAEYVNAGIRSSLVDDLKTAHHMGLMAIQHDNSSHEGHILLSITYLLEHNDPKQALNHALLASNTAHGNPTWLYNAAFLLMLLGNYDKSLSYYYKITQLPTGSDQLIIPEVLTFCDVWLRDHPDHIWAIFISAIVRYRRTNELSEAALGFKSFIEKAKTTKQPLILIEKAKTYLKEIHQIQSTSS